MRTLLLTSAIALTALSCNGPKGSPQGSIESYYDAAASKDWSTMAGMLTAESLRTAGGPDRAAAFLEANLARCTRFKVDVGEVLITKGGDTASAPVTCQCRLIGQNDHKEYWAGCSATYQLKKQSDGKWYVTLPGSTPLNVRM